MDISTLTDDAIMLEIKQLNITLAGLYLRDGYTHNNGALVNEIQARRQATNKRLDALFSEMDKRYPESE